TPTLDCAAAVPTNISAVVPASAAFRRDPPLTLPMVMCVSDQPTLEAPTYPKHQVIVGECVIRNGGISHKTPARQTKCSAVIERDGQHQIRNCISLISIGSGVDRRIGGVVGPPLLGYR